MGTYTREIQIAGRNRWYCGYISVDGVSTVNDTTSRITITAALDDKYAAQYGTHYDVIVNGITYRSRDVLLNNYGNWATRDAVTFTVDVGRGASGWNCSVQIHVYGKTYNNYYGSAGGDAWATEYAWIPQRGYSQPHPPKNPKLARVSDTSHKIAWDVDYTGMDGAYPWAGVYVDRRTDDGSWVNIVGRDQLHRQLDDRRPQVRVPPLRPRPWRQLHARVLRNHVHNSVGTFAHRCHQGRRVRGDAARLRGVVVRQRMGCSAIRRRREDVGGGLDHHRGRRPRMGRPARHLRACRHDRLPRQGQAR